MTPEKTKRACPTSTARPPSLLCLPTRKSHPLCEAQTPSCQSHPPCLYLGALDPADQEGPHREGLPTPSEAALPPWSKLRLTQGPTLIPLGT